MSKSVKTTPRKAPPPPEAGTIQRGSAPVAVQSSDKKLAQLEKKARESGDRTELIRYRSELKAKQKAA